MCGLTYFHNLGVNSVAKSIRKRYEAQKHRGTEGFGLVSFCLEDQKISYHLRHADEKTILDDLNFLEDKKANGILFHHRHPTSTLNISECAHPIEVRNEKLDYIYYVAHNGVISNAEELKEKHEKLGYEYTTQLIKEERWTTTKDKFYTGRVEIEFNDSEALAIEIARYIDGESATMEAEGSMAVIVLQASKDGKVKKLYYGRNQENPLYKTEDKQILSLTSLGELKNSVDPNVLYSYDYLTGKTEEKPLAFKTRWMWKKDETKTIGFNLENERMDNLKEKGNTKAPAGALPPVSYDEYMKLPSQIDFKLPNLIKEHLWSDIQDFTINEILVVEELISWETYLERKDRVAILEKRLLALQDRDDEIYQEMDDERMQEADAYGLTPEDMGEYRRQLPIIKNF